MTTSCSVHLGHLHLWLVSSSWSSSSSYSSLTRRCSTSSLAIEWKGWLTWTLSALDLLVIEFCSQLASIARSNWQLDLPEDDLRANQRSEEKLLHSRCWTSWPFRVGCPGHSKIPRRTSRSVAPPKSPGRTWGAFWWTNCPRWPGCTCCSRDSKCPLWATVGTCERPVAQSPRRLPVAWLTGRRRNIDSDSGEDDSMLTSMDQVQEETELLTSVTSELRLMVPPHSSAG